MAPPPLHTWKVLSYQDITHDVFVVTLERPEGVQFKAGQYMSIVIPGAGPGGRNLRRAYSIASPPEQSTIELCVKLVDGGPGTNYLAKLREGDTLQAQCPFGDFYLEHDLALPTVFIGTGTGIAPFRSMVLSKDWNTKADVAFLLGVRAEKDILYPELFKAGDVFSSLDHVKICLSRPETKWDGFSGRVTNYLKSMNFDLKKAHYYLCGSGAMLTEVKEFLMQEKGVEKDQIHTEKYY